MLVESGTLSITGSVGMTTSAGASFRMKGGSLNVTKLTMSANTSWELVSLSKQPSGAVFGSLDMGDKSMIVDFGGLSTIENDKYQLFGVSDSSFVLNAANFAGKNLGAGKKINFIFENGSVWFEISGNNSHTWVGTGTLTLTTGDAGWNGEEGFSAGDDILLQGTGETNLLISGAVAPAGIYATSGTYNISSTEGSTGLSGGGVLSVDGDGVIVSVNSANASFSGSVEVKKGILNASVANALGQGALLSVSGGVVNLSANQNFTSTSLTGGQLVLKSTGALGGLGTISGNSGTLVVDWGDEHIAPSAGLISYKGALLIESGRVNANNTSVLSASSITINDNGQLYVNGGTWKQDFHISGKGWQQTADSGASGALRMDVGTLEGKLILDGDAYLRVHGGNGTISGLLEGGYQLTKVGAGTLTLSNAASLSTFGGTIRAEEGTLNISGANGNFAGTITVGRGASLQLQSIGSGQSALTSGNVVIESGGKLAFMGNNGAFTSKVGTKITLKGGAEVYGTNPASAANSISTDFILDTAVGEYANIGGFTQGNATLIYSTISGTGNLSIKDEGSGSGDANGFSFCDGWMSNSYTGLTLIRRVMTFKVSSNTVTDDQTLTPFGVYNADGTSGVATIENGQLTISGNSGTTKDKKVTIANGFMFNGGNLALNDLGEATVSGSVTVSTTGTLSSNCESLILAGGFKGTAGLTYNGINSVLSLSGTENDYQGILTIGTASGVRIASGAEGLERATIASIDGKTVYLGDERDTSAAVLDMNITVTGGGSLVKEGAGTATVAGDNLAGFTGSISVNGGKLQIGNGGQIGQIGAGDVTIAANGELAFSYAAGTDKSFGNRFTGAAGSKITFDGGNLSFSGDLSGFTGLLASSTGNWARTGSGLGRYIDMGATGTLSTNGISWTTADGTYLKYGSTSNTWNLSNTTLAGTGKIVFDVSSVTDYLVEQEYMLADWTGGAWTELNSEVRFSQIGDFTCNILRDGGRLSLKYVLSANAFQWTGAEENAGTTGAGGQAAAPTAADNVYLTEKAFENSPGKTELTVQTGDGLAVKSLTANVGSGHTYVVDGNQSGSGFQAEGLTKSGGGTLVLKSVNSFGSIALSGGDTVIGNAHAFNSSSVDIVMTDQATLTYGENADGWETGDTISGSIRLASGSTSANVNVSAGAGTVTWTGYEGAADVTKAGVGTLQLDLAGTGVDIASNIVVNEGDLDLRSGTYNGSISMGVGAGDLLVTGDTAFGGALSLAASRGVRLQAGILTEERTGGIAYEVSLEGGDLHFANDGIYNGKIVVNDANSLISSGGRTELAGEIELKGNHSLKLGAGTFVWNTSSDLIELGDNTSLVHGRNTSFKNISMTSSSSLSGAYEVSVESGSLNGVIDTSVIMTGDAAGVGELNLNGADITKLIVKGGTSIKGTTGTIGALEIDLNGAYEVNFNGMDGGKITSLNMTGEGSRLTGLANTISVDTATLTFGVDESVLNGRAGAESVISGADLTVSGAFTANLSDSLVAAIKAMGEGSIDIRLRATDGILSANIGDVTYGNSMSLRVSNTTISDGYINFTASLNDIFIASVDGTVTKPDAYTLSSYSAMDDFISMQMDHDMTIRLPGAAPADHLDGMVIRQMYGTEAASRNSTLTITNSTPGATGLLTLRNSTADTVYAGNINSRDTDLVKDGEYSLTLGGRLEVAGSGSFSIKEGVFDLSGAGVQHSVNMLDVQGDGKLLLGGTGSSLTIQGIKDGVNGEISILNGASLNIDFGTSPLSWFNGSLNSSDYSGNVNVKSGTLALGAGATVNGINISIEDRAGLNVLDGVEVNARNFNGDDLAVLQGGGTINVSGEGNFKGEMNTFSGKISSVGGDLVLAGKGSSQADVSALAGGKLTLDYTTWGATYGSLTVNGGGTARLLAYNDDGKNNTLTLTGNSSVANGTLAFVLNTNPVQNLDMGFITMADGAVMNFGEGAVLSFSASSSSTAIQGTSPLEIVILNGASTGSEQATISYDALFGKYFDASKTRLEQRGDKLVMITEASTSPFYASYAGTENSRAGGRLLDNVLRTHNPQVQAAGSTLALAMNELDSMINRGETGRASSVMAAMAGASVTTLNAAQLGSQERFANFLRNRGNGAVLEPGFVYSDLPYWSGWMSAGGAGTELSADADNAGYSLNSWNAALGADCNIGESTALGLAFTADYGKLTSKGADSAKGRVDSYLAGVYLNVASGPWSHVGVISGGVAKAKLDRTVNYGGGVYNTQGDTDGVSFAVMYEAAYSIPVDKVRGSVFQPLFRAAFNSATMKGYKETGAGNAGLDVDDMETSYATVGIGARYVTPIGQNLFNRKATFELRLMALQDIGDRQVEADVNFVDARGRRQTVKGTKPGSFGGEAGLGLNVPVATQGSVFVDAYIDARDKGTSAGGSIGYRYNF